MREPASAEERIFLDALTTYADSCTQPQLTPSCPYFRIDDGRPVCGEECRSILESHGVADRPVRVSAVGGLLMTGRAIPTSAVAGHNAFDAAQNFLNDRDKPVDEQSTSSLLLSLRAQLTRNVLRAEPDHVAPLSLWGELLRRGIDMDNVFAGALASIVASAVSVRVLVELLAKDEVVDASDIIGDGERRWASIIENDVAAERTDHFAWDRRKLSSLMSALGSESSVLNDSGTLSTIISRPDIQYVVSEAFTSRISAWLNGLASHDLEAAMRVDPPAAGLFPALPISEVRHTGGMWIWERFTVTELTRWSTSSLLQEWQWSRGGRTQLCEARTMMERVITANQVTDAAMSALDRDDKEHLQVELFHPGRYVQIAANHLAVGDWDKAVKLFEGLVALRPGDGEAWNNLGFCQLGTSATIALPMFRRAAALQRPVPLISWANQALALHLLGQDDEASNFARKGIGNASDSNDWQATVWHHPVADGELELGDTPTVKEYLINLLAHIENGDCTSRGEDFAS